MQKSEIRKDYIQEKYVIIAPHRGNRPHDVEKPQRQQPNKPTECVFCPGKVDKVSKVLATINETKEKNEPWAIKVIANKFPSVSVNNPKAYGQQEVIIETPNHFLEIEDLSVKRISKILEIYAKRTEVISRDKKINYVIIFKNDGGVAGASIQHSHSQIFATEFLPPHLEDRSRRVQAYRLKHGTCIYCDVIKKERKGPRLVWEDKHVIAFCPWAPMHNYEIWIMPKRHVDNVTNLNETERNCFAKAMKKILKKISKLNLPYNYYFHQIVKDENEHLYIKITPRGSVWAGVEIGSGLIINPIAPEDAAAFYRK
ncbi:MAG: galactose-1-phosphate uridylyltransferase [Candidatus Buchananbacteria bacterium]